MTYFDNAFIFLFFDLFEAGGVFSSTPYLLSERNQRKFILHTIRSLKGSDSTLHRPSKNRLHGREFPKRLVQLISF
jgi:hypothetical protein